MVKSPTKSTRRRKKSAKAGDDADAFVDSAKKDDVNDKDFQTPRAGNEVEVFEGEEEYPENLESTAVSWGLLALGGLGLCSVGTLLS